MECRVGRIWVRLARHHFISLRGERRLGSRGERLAIPMMSSVPPSSGEVRCGGYGDSFGRDSPPSPSESEGGRGVPPSSPSCHANSPDPHLPYLGPLFCNLPFLNALPFPPLSSPHTTSPSFHPTSPSHSLLEDIYAPPLPSPPQREALSSLRYGSSEVWLHTDPSLMPRRREAWASWNCIQTEGDGPVCVSYWVNLLQNLPEGTTSSLVSHLYNLRDITTLTSNCWPVTYLLQIWRNLHCRA